MSWHGGGGWGDPLSRPAEAVAEDVRQGVTSPAHAASVYGVVLDESGGPDHELTQRRRQEIQRKRIGRDAETRDAATPGSANEGRSIGGALRLRRDGDQICVVTAAGAVLSRGDTRWRAGAVRCTVDASELNITLHDELTMTAPYCPVSADLLAVDVHRRDAEPSDDLILELDG